MNFFFNILGQLLAKRRESKGHISCQHLFAELIPLFRVQIHLLNLLRSSKCLHVDNFNPSEPRTFSQTFLWAPLLWKFTLVNPDVMASLKVAQICFFSVVQPWHARLSVAWWTFVSSASVEVISLDSMSSCSSVYTNIHNSPDLEVIKNEMS